MTDAEAQDKLERALKGLRLHRDVGGTDIYVVVDGTTIVLDPLSVSTIMAHNMTVVTGALVNWPNKED